MEGKGFTLVNVIIIISLMGLAALYFFKKIAVIHEQRLVDEKAYIVGSVSENGR